MRNPTTPSPISPASPGTNRAETSILPAALVGLGALALYALTSSPFVGAEDIAEFQTLGASPGIAHAGYPLLTLALEAAHRLPFGTAAYRANLVSALSGALAVALAVHAATRYTASRVAAWVVGGALTLAYSLWHDSTRAEVYAFTLPLGAGAFLALLAFHEGQRKRALFLSFLLVGLGLTSHLSSLAIATVAGASLVIRIARREVRPSALWPAAAGLLCGLSPFLVTLARDVPGAPMNYIEYTFDAWSGAHVPWATDVGTRLRRLVVLLSGHQYLSSTWFQPFKDTILRLRLVGHGVFLNDLPALGAVLAFAGAVIAVRRRSASDLLLLGWLGATLFWLAFGAYPMVVGSFFLPGLWCLALFASSALAATARRPVLFAALALVLVATAVVRPLLRTPPAGLERSSLAVSTWRQFPVEWSPFAHDDSWDEFGRGALENVGPWSTILVCWEEGTVLLYMRHAAGLRPDVEVKPACASDARLAAAIQAAGAQGRVVYTTIPEATRPGHHDWELVQRWERGGLWRLRAAASARPPTLH